MRTSNSQFEDLLSTSIRDWPTGEIDLSTLENANIDVTRYSVKGLGVLADSISERYIGHQKEVVFRNLHEAILEVLHSVAQYMTKVRIADLRNEAIRTRFERRLREILKDSEPGWEKQDIEIIQSYFALEK